MSARGAQARALLEGDGHPLVPPGERVLYDARPSVWYILVRGIPECVPAVVLGVVVWLLRGLTVVSADTQLLAASKTAGLHIINPEED